ncbi:unnamed protein product [Phaedon cochleariae]|uniref:ubiquitinyl hydrolase 1 n=1 Tax=Phaedon cochleariae TaxID=80249 RepID=A0A9N9SJY4_PHACE|nr:unnamed protein product [Phaedon cochleariae]
MQLSHCMECFTCEEFLDEDDMPICSKCKERRKCTETLSFHKFPKVLVIHLKRFMSSVCSSDEVNVIIDILLEGLDLSSYSPYALSNHKSTM